MRALWQDVRFGIRVLSRTPWWTTLAVTMLACGIGGSAAAFSLAYALFWQRLPVKDAAGLVQIHQTLAWRNERAAFEISFTDYLHYRDHSRTLGALAAHYSTAPLHVRASAGVWDVNGSVVTANYFQILGLEPALGRFFTPAEDGVRDTHRVAIVGYDFWERELAATPDVLQQSLSINGDAFTIVGVAPRGFRGVVAGVLNTDVWIPSGMFRVGYRPCDAFGRNCRVVQMLGRLAPGVALATAQSELDMLAGQLVTAFPETNKGRGVRAVPLRGIRLQEQAANARGAVLLASAAGLVLAIACANLAGLLLARGISRRREVAMRRSLGASRMRIVRQLLTESLLLAMAGGAAGVLVAVWATDLLRAFYGVSYVGSPLNFELRQNPAVLGFTLLVTLTTSILFGLAPALRSSRADVLPALKDEAPAMPGAGSRVRDALVIAQIALAVVLLSAATLFVRSGRYIGAGPGFDATRIALLRLRPAQIGVDPARARRFQEQVIQRLESTPGILSASPATHPPLPGWGPDVTVSSAEDRDRRPEEGLQAGANAVGPRYFETLGLAPLAGREFDDGDRPGGQPVVIVNETLARRFWQPGEAVGRLLTVDNASYQVVGVAPDAQYTGPAAPSKPFVYFNYWQRERAQGDGHTLVRVHGDARPMLPSLRDAVTRVDPDVPIGVNQRLSDRVGWEFGSLRALRAALIWFSGAGTLLCAIGLYGLLAFTVSLRAREMAIRMALGARPGDLVRHLASRSATLLTAGVGIGLLSAGAAVRYISSLLYGVTGVDPTTLVLVSLTLAAVSMLASYVPARSVTRVDPASIFRST